MAKSSTPTLGIYANYLVVAHNAFEFVLDFGQLYQGDDDPVMHTRVITTPVYAKAMLATLQASIARFEGVLGVISQEEDHTQ
jgi:hypothetical protein